MGALLSRVRYSDTGPAGLWALQELAKVPSGSSSASQPHQAHVPPFSMTSLTLKFSWILPDKNSRGKPLPFPNRQFSQQYVPCCSSLDEKWGCFDSKHLFKMFVHTHTHTHTSTCLNHQFGKFCGPVFGGESFSEFEVKEN